MNESLQIGNPNNYKILIQQKFNRAKRIKCKYLNSDLEFIENENEALEFPNFQAAEKHLNTFFPSNKLNPKPRIIVKYKLNGTENFE